MSRRTIWLRHGAVFAAHLCFVAVVYGPMRRLGMMSDAWVILDQARRGWWRAVSTVIGYHYIPVASAFVNVCWNAFGSRPLPWQLLNLAQFALVAHLVYQLGRRLLPSAWLAFLASLLFLSNASFHEIAFWPVNGNIHSLSATFYLLGMLVALDMGSRPDRARRGWVFALLALLAMFTYEGTATMIPVAAAVLVLRLPPVGQRSSLPTPRVLWQGVVKPLLPCVLVVGLLVLAKLSFARETTGATQVELGVQRLYWLVKGTAGIFSLRGSHDVLQRMISLGFPAPPVPRGFVLGWVGAGVGALVLILWKSRSDAPRLLAAWLAIHLAFIAAAVGMAPRHGYLPAVPAALLTAWTLGALARSLGRRLGSGDSPQWAAHLATVPVVLLVLLAHRDLQIARLAWGQASEANAKTVELLRYLAPLRRRPITVCYVNMPGVLPQGGIGAFAFLNGLGELTRMKTPGAGRIELAHTHGSAAPGRFASESAPVSLVEVERWAASGDRIVVYFDPVTRQVEALTPATATRPDRYLPHTSPLLDWLPGSWWWFRVPARTSLELPLRPLADDAWIAVRYLHDRDTRFNLRVGPEAVLAVGPRQGEPAWAVSAAALPAAQAGEPLRIDALAEGRFAHVWSFLPQARYDPSRAPFLDWAEAKTPYLTLATPLELPLDTRGCAPCRLRVEYMAEPGREVVATVEGSPDLRLGGAAGAGWAQGLVVLPPRDSGAVRLRLTPVGALPPFVKSLRVEADASVPQAGS